jgi:hypothetical protein
VLDRKRTRIGSEVWGVFYQGSTQPWRVGLVGHVQRITSEGVIVGGKLHGWTEHPLELTREAMQRWAGDNPPKAPGISGLVSG